MISRVAGVDDRDLAELDPYSHITRTFGSGSIIIARVPEIDIEGYEIHALMGAHCLMERGVPVVMELNTPVLEAAGRVDQLLPTVAPHYTHVVRLGDLKKGGESTAFQPIESITRLLEEARSVKAMDILVCRVP